MERISLRCANGHPDIEVMGFIRRSEAEALAHLADGPEPPSEAAIERARSKAGRWMVDTQAGRQSEHVRGPRALSEPPRPRSKWDGEMVWPRCPVCESNPLVDGVRWGPLRRALHDLATHGELKPNLSTLAAVIRRGSTQRRS